MNHNKYTTPGNKIIYIDDNIVRLKCSNCEETFIISRESLKDISSRTWYLDIFGYLNSSYMNKGIKLHRYLLRNELNKPENIGLVVDHIDRNPLNNKLDNLRIVPQRINKINSSQSINTRINLYGVDPCVYKERVYYCARIFDGKSKLLGIFDDPYDAALVHDRYIFIYKTNQEWNATNIMNDLIPKEILLKYNIKYHDLSSIPFIPSSKHSSSKYNGLTFYKKKGVWKSYVKDERNKLKNTGSSKNENIAAMKRELYILSHQKIDINKGCNKPNSIITKETDGKINKD